MKDIGFINNYRKERVYNTYASLEIDVKEYEKITRKQMLEAIYHELVNDSESLEGYVSFDQLSLFIKIVKGEIDPNTKEYKESIELGNLKQVFLLYFDYEQNKFVVPSFLIENIDKLITSSLHHIKDEFHDFMKGLILTRGEIGVKEAFLIFEELKPKHMDLAFEQLMFSSSRLLKLINVDEYMYDGTFRYEDNHVKIKEDYEPQFKYTWKMYSSLGKYHINREVPVLEKLYQLLIKSNKESSIYWFLERFICDTQYNHTFSYKELIQYILDATDDIDESIRFVNEITKEFPIWAFKGDPLSSIDFSRLKNEFIEEDEIIPEPYTESEIKMFLKNKAIMTEEYSALFYFLIHILMYEAALKYNLTDVDNVPDFIDNLEQKDFIDIKNIIFDDEEIIMNFGRKHSDKFDHDFYEILNGFKKSVKGNFVALGYENNKLLLWHETTNIIYVVGGIMSIIGETIPENKLPMYVKTRLVPLKDRIVYDIFIETIPVSLGPNIVKSINQRIKRAKKVYDVRAFK